MSQLALNTNHAYFPSCLYFHLEMTNLSMLTCWPVHVHWIPRPQVKIHCYIFTAIGDSMLKFDASLRALRSYNYAFTDAATMVNTILIHSHVVRNSAHWLEEYINVCFLAIESFEWGIRYYAGTWQKSMPCKMHAIIPKHHWFNMYTWSALLVLWDNWTWNWDKI